jgi:hypothetical protein
LEKQDHYTVLRISSTATEKEIKASYYALSLEFHPDRVQGSLPDVSEPERQRRVKEAAERFLRIRQAYDTLRDPAARRHYDEMRMNHSPQHARHRTPVRHRHGGVHFTQQDSYEYWETKFKRAAQYAQDDPFLYAMREEERLALERRKRLIRQHGWIKGVYLSLFPQSERRAKELRFILIMVCGVVFLVSTHLYVIQQQQKLKRELLERRSNPGSSLTEEEEMWLARAGFPRQNPDMNSASFLGWSSRDGGGKPTQPDEDILPPLRGRTSSTYVPRKYEGRLPSQIPPASASMAGSKPIPPAALPPVTASDPPTPSPSSSVSKSA